MRQRKAKKILAAVPETYDAIAEEFDRTRNDPVAEFTFYKPYLKPGASVADIGCGNGRLLKSLEYDKISYTGLDNSKTMISIARKSFPRNKFAHGDFMKTGLPDSSQDVVFALRSFHHLPDEITRKQALAEIIRILRPNGILIISVWNLLQKKFRYALFRAALRFIFTFGGYAWNDFFIPWGKKKKRYYHAFTPPELADLVKDSGFEIQEEFCVKKDRKMPFKQAHDIVLIARKIPKIAET